MTTQNGKAGLCATVMMPLLTTKQQELPGPYLHLKCTVRLQENVTVNMGPPGLKSRAKTLQLPQPKHSISGPPAGLPAFSTPRQIPLLQPPIPTAWSLTTWLSKAT